MIRNEIGASNPLTIPDTFKPLQFLWKFSFIQDVTINILEFIQFGFYFPALFIKVTRGMRSMVYEMVALAGMRISLSIELTQAYLPTRDFSLIDVLMNSARTILGIVLFQFLST